MPYSVKKSSSCPESRSYAVVKTATGEVVACHSSPGSAGKQIGAITHNEKMKASVWSERMRALIDSATTCFPFELITVDGNEIIVEVAARDSQRNVGLKFREAPRHDGMLFEYDSDVEVKFTMQDVAFDLDFYWFSAEGHLLGYTTRKAYDPAPVEPPGPFRYVLETPAGSLTVNPHARLDRKL